MPNRGRGYLSLADRGVIRMPSPAASDRAWPSPGPSTGPGPQPAAGTSPDSTAGLRADEPAGRRAGERAQRTVWVAGRHVWVLAGGGARLPGLLTQWRREPSTPADRRRDGGWSALVVYTVDVDGQPALVQAWVPADRLRPADTR